MQSINIPNNLIAPENLKCTEINSYVSQVHFAFLQVSRIRGDNINKLDEIRQKNFLNGLQNARNILTSLQNSLDKSSAYEKKLLRCKASHYHLHDAEEDINGEWWDDGFDKDDGLENKLAKSHEAIKKTTSYHVDLVESWSTMSIVCLQYQYEELSKRYESLLQAYNDKCEVVTDREKALSSLKQRAGNLHAQLAHAHKTLISVGEKYLNLRRRRNMQLSVYEKKIDFLKGRIREVVSAVDRARLHLDNQIAINMASELDSEYALLLGEMRKCNRLLVENLQLKAQLEELMPGSIHWNQ